MAFVVACDRVVRHRLRLLDKPLSIVVICTAIVFRIAENEECFLTLIHFNTSTADTFCLNTVPGVMFILVLLILDKSVEDFGMVGAIAIPSDNNLCWENRPLPLSLVYTFHTDKNIL